MPWPGTSALYWTEVEVMAPDQEGMFWYAVNFAATDVETPHDGASSKFSVAIVRPPEHRLTVEVLEKASLTLPAGQDLPSLLSSIIPARKAALLAGDTAR